MYPFNQKIIISQAEEKDVLSMLELNYKIYPKEWHVSPEFVFEVLKKNKEVYNLIKINGEVKGISTFFPLDEQTYHGVLKGEINERELCNYLLDYEQPKEVYLYLISIIVDISENHDKVYSRPLILNIPNQLKKIIEKGMIIKEIGAIAISEDGNNILKRIGFELHDYLLEDDKKYEVYKASAENVIRVIKDRK